MLVFPERSTGLDLQNEQVLVLLAIVLGIIGGVLLCKGTIDMVIGIFEGGRGFSVESAAVFGMGVVIIASSIVISKGSHLAGGLINIILGVLTFSYGREAEGILVLVSGVLGILAPKV